VHVSRTLLTSELDRGLHQRPPQPLPASVGHHVQLLDVAVERFLPERRTESEHREPIGLGSTEEDRDLARGEEVSNASGNGARAGRGLVELSVEVVEETADGLGVGGLAPADVGGLAFGHFGQLVKGLTARTVPYLRSRSGTGRRSYSTPQRAADAVAVLDALWIEPRHRYP